VKRSIFSAMADFARRVAELAEYVKSCPTAPGVERIYVPGEVEALERERRLREGIVVQNVIWEKMLAICDRYRIAVPA
jgi:uncharacterized oxidoreductase